MQVGGYLSKPDHRLGLYNFKKENASKFKTKRRHFIRIVFGLTAPDEEQGPPPGGRFTGLDWVCLGLPGGDREGRVLRTVRVPRLVP